MGSNHAPVGVRIGDYRPTSFDRVSLELRKVVGDSGTASLVQRSSGEP